MKRIFFLTYIFLVTILRCSLILDFKECEKNSDCFSKGINSICSSENFCIDRNSLQLTSNVCRQTYGPVDDRNTIIFGAIFPLTKEYYDSGIPAEKSLKMAIDEINNYSQGVLPGHRIGAIICDSEGDKNLAVKAGEFLKSLGITAIIGDLFSGPTLEIATKVAIPNKILLISPSATSPAISDLSDDDLIFRTAPSDTLQGKAMSNIVIKKNFKRVAEIHKADAYGIGLSSVIVSELNAKILSKQIEYKKIEYKDISTEPINYSSMYSELHEFSPDVVILIGTDEIISILENLLKLMKNDEREKWNWLLSDGGLLESLIQLLKKNKDLCSKLFGTISGTLQTQNYLNFSLNFTSKYPEYKTAPAYSENTYDAVYLLAYAFATLKNKEITGNSLSKGLRKLNDSKGRPINAGVKDLPLALQELWNGKTIDYNGASGKIDFDKKGDPKGVIFLWWVNCEKFEFENCLILGEEGEFYDLPEFLK